MGLDQVLSDLETDGYTSRTFIVPAAGVDAPHKRDRVWIVARNMADSNNEGLRPRVRGAVSEFIQKNDERCDHTGGVRNNDSDQNGEPSILSKNEETLADTTLQLSHERLNPNRSKEIGQSGVRSKIGRGSEDVANTKSEGLQDVGGCSELVREQDRRHLLETSSSATGTNFWEPEPNVGRVANGIPQRVDRLKALGNAIVPQIAMRIAFTIKEIEAQQK
jgi:DNA (cytosine-5)-methyltransferase 1